LNDLLGKDTSNANGTPFPERLTDGICGQANFNGIAASGGGMTFGGTAINTPERAYLVARAFLAKGYNNNYAASWFLSRGGLKLELEDAGATSKIAAVTSQGASVVGGAKNLHGALGPLTRRMVESSPIVSSNIPLLGDASPGDINEASLARTIEFKSTAADPWSALPDGKANRTFIIQGSLLTEAANDGPGSYDTSANKVVLLTTQAAAVPPAATTVTPTSDMTGQIACEQNGKTCAPATVGAYSGANSYLQDTRDWFALHGGGSQSSANILFADGSVKEFSDTNGDRYLNPGFPVASGLTDGEYGAIGYRSDVQELPEGQIFSKVFITKMSKTKFE
jgi:prepilin-type processing-associated H-X9-DG protein